MGIMWMKEQAKWIIAIFGVLIVVGLLMMDRAGSMQGQQQGDAIGKVEGVEIRRAEFQNKLDNYVRSEEQRTGQAPQGLQLAQMRENLFNFEVQSILLERAMKRYELFASVEEMQDYLLKHPQEVAMQIRRYGQIENIPSFLADSVIDPTRYAAWLAQDSVYDRRSMLEFENQMRESIIPQVQLQQLLKSQFHNTVLEESFQVASRENKARLQYYRVSTDSFTVDPERYAEADLRRYFEAHPDSFHRADEAARLAYVRLDIKASKADSLLMLEQAKKVAAEAKGGANFAELATSHSDDQGSAERGGNLGGYQPRTAWVPAFADAAFALNPGEISEPVASPFGYHVILLHGKKVEDGVEKADASHILFRVVPGYETKDSLQRFARELREKALEEGSLKKVAASMSLRYDTTELFDKKSLMPIPNTYVQGLHSFAFSKVEAKEKISEELETDEAYFLFERLRKFPAGRDFERSRPAIRQILAQEEKLRKAKEELAKQETAIKALTDSVLPPVLGKAVLDSSGLIGGEAWLAGYGYASPALFRALAQPVGVWGSIQTTEAGAAMARVAEKAFLPNDQLADKARAGLKQAEASQIGMLFQTWLAGLQKAADIENQLDMSYRF